MEVDGGYFWAEQLFSSHEYWDDDYDYEDYFRDGEEFVFEIHTPSSTGQPEDFSTPRYEVDQDCGSPCEGTIESETVAFSECPVITAPRQVNWVQSRLVIRNVRCIDVTSPRQGPDVSASTDSRFLPPLRHISLGQFVSLYLLPLHPNKFVPLPLPRQDLLRLHQRRGLRRVRRSLGGPRPHRGEQRPHEPRLRLAPQHRGSRHRQQGRHQGGPRAANCSGELSFRAIAAGIIIAKD